MMRDRVAGTFFQYEVILFRISKASPIVFLFTVFPHPPLLSRLLQPFSRSVACAHPCPIISPPASESQNVIELNGLRTLLIFTLCERNFAEEDNMCASRW